MTAQEVQVGAGLTTAQALENIKKYGVNQLKSQKLSPVNIFVRQFKGNYLTYILIVCTLTSFLLGERISSLYIFVMILLSSILGFWNEYSAQKVVDSLLSRITPKVLVKRDGKIEELLITQITVCDIVLFSTGSVIPADLRILESENLEVNESALTGESAAIIKKIDDIVYMGTNVESGHGLGLVTQVGESTSYGKIAKSLSFLKPETSFQIGLRQFGNFLVRIILIIAVGIFVINAGLGKPWLTSLMFALAIAVGLTPELLPVVITLSLSHGAGRLGKKRVVVKQLVAVENLGNMDILCCDKTGTLTEGKIELTDYLGIDGKKSRQVLEKAYLSCPQVSHYKHIFDPIDKAVLAGVQEVGVDKGMGRIDYLDTEPFDYDKKASFNLVSFEGEKRLVVKGSYDEVAAMCGEGDARNGLDLSSSKISRNKDRLHELNAKVLKLSQLGYRVVAVAEKIVSQEINACTWNDAKSMGFIGILVFSDPPKKDAKHALDRLEKLNVGLKVLTGDSESVALKVCADVGLPVTGVVLGSQLDAMDLPQLEKSVLKNNLFARVSPENKLTIIKTLQKLGHTVGFLGDGINDAPALHTADVGISVNTASDTAKQSASVVLLRKSLDVLIDGVIEGRKIFNNTVKYILMGTSSNFGNMFSASLASVALPFLPMTPVQILLNNTLYDFSQLTIPGDRVDPDSLLKPRHWDIGFIKKYMLFFGPISSLFDFITFGFLLLVFKLGESGFQTGWFLESLVTQVLVIFVIRTAKFPFSKSKPSKSLIVSSVLVISGALALVLSPLRSSFGFAPVSVPYLGFLIIATFIYLQLVDLLKLYFIKKFKVWN